MTITSSQAPTRATIIAGPNLSAMMMEQPNPGLRFFIYYISFEGMVDTPGWRVACNGNLILSGTDFEFAHNEVKGSCVGLGLALSGDRYNVWDNYIAYNGRDVFSGGPWSDGITALRCNGGAIHDNVLVDNTDIDLVVGGGPFCNVQNNTIWHGGKYAFASLNLGSFINSAPYVGVHFGSLFTGNTIVNTVFNRLGQGLSVGSHPWPDGVNLWITDTGTVSGNTISGANVNLLIEGLGIPREGGIDPAPGSVAGNNPSGAMGNSDCPNPTTTP